MSSRWTVLTLSLALTATATTVHATTTHATAAPAATASHATPATHATPTGTTTATPATPASPATAAAIPAAPTSHVPADLAKEAKVSLDKARTAALAESHGGTLRSEELLREHGHLVYRFEIAPAAGGASQHVDVSAMTGKVFPEHSSQAHAATAKEPAKHGRR